ncbi:MAG: MBL fold metallo-hydrolase RNA specificity domain-containing protein, partial [Desulfonatronovibrionaceae bacterium]
METARESMSLNSYQGPAIIISASGMANAGRVKHHLKHNIWRKGCSVVIVGFQARGTPGRKLVDGAESIRILGEDLAVRARIFTINGFSAHAGQTQLLDWLGNFTSNHMKVFLIHGEYASQKVLAGVIKARFGHEVIIPEYLEQCILEKGLVREVQYLEGLQPKVDWKDLLQGFENRADRIHRNLKLLEGMDRDQQLEIQDKVLEAQKTMDEIIQNLDADLS